MMKPSRVPTVPREQTRPQRARRPASARGTVVEVCEPVYTRPMVAGSESLQRLYAEFEGEVRPAFGKEAERAREYYRRYVNFVMQQLPSGPARILDIGCGA